MPHGRTLAIATLLVAALAPTAAHARTPPPKLTGLRCVPATRAACHPRPQVMIGKQVQLRGTGLKAGMRVSFRWSKGALATKLQALADGLGGPRPARDQGRDDLGARHRPRRAPIAA